MNTEKKLLIALAIAVAVSACSKPETSAEAAAPAPEAMEAAAAEATDTAIAAASGTYVLDPTHTDVLVQWSHFGFSHPSAHFGNVEGTLVYNAEDPAQSSVEVTLPLSGLDSFVPKLDEHLKGADFFDAATYPVATFKSTAVESAGVNALKVTGDLTIKDQTHPVVLDVTLNGAGQHPMLGAPAIGFSATGQLKRTDFGVGAYAPNVSDEVELRITTEGTIPAEPAVN
ncbi:polyisoprenoid-binding protein [Pseudoxanthomonas kalamensis DSM 18571]|uniref:YceI family protein n=1 Tax=Pseudoxanthomonas kalamensis TaxID=289483 RepID=UPI0013916718|nr:YceI family protein [Pseudoxanthomonas kalamensis]KAF1712012.1 polyisoprenoid-binding protein [Pseudoxanthomonas kalamensis DSM 18571]